MGKTSTLWRAIEVDHYFGGVREGARTVAMSMNFKTCFACVGSGSVSTTEYRGGRYYNVRATCTWCGGMGGTWAYNSASDNSSSVTGASSRPARQPRRPKTPEEEDAQFNG